ncbi:MAG: Zn-ribbon domain-containing OB-fold protein [Alphaproteobacteria bacterium]
MAEPVDDAALRFVMRERTSKGTIYPTWSVDTAPYWMGCAKGALLYQVCSDCSTNVFHPRAVCHECLSSKLKWVQSKGLGTIYSFSIQHVPLDRSRPQKPRALGIIQLDEGWHMFSEIVCEALEAIKIGQRVRVFFHKTADDLVLPKFRPEDATQGSSHAV